MEFKTSSSPCLGRWAVSFMGTESRHYPLIIKGKWPSDPINPEFS